MLFRSKTARKREHLDRLALPGSQPLLTETSRRAHVESLLKQRDPERLAADVITLQRQFSSLQEEHVRHSMCSAGCLPCLSKVGVMQNEHVRQCMCSAGYVLVPGLKVHCKDLQDQLAKMLLSLHMGCHPIGHTGAVVCMAGYVTLAGLTGSAAACR